MTSSLLPFQRYIWMTMKKVSSLILWMFSSVKNGKNSHEPKTRISQIQIYQKLKHLARVFLVSLIADSYVNKLFDFSSKIILLTAAVHFAFGRIFENTIYMAGITIAKVCSDGKMYSSVPNWWTLTDQFLENQYFSLRPTSGVTQQQQQHSSSVFFTRGSKNNKFTDFEFQTAFVLQYIIFGQFCFTGSRTVTSDHHFFLWNYKEEKSSKTRMPFV